LLVSESRQLTLVRTIFLDEIRELSLASQTLLHVLQDKQIERFGACHRPSTER